MTDTCERTTCTRPQWKMRLCSTHYQFLIRSGETGYTDSAASLERLDTLHRMGWENHQISAASGLCKSTIQKVLKDRRPRLRTRTAKLILAVPAVPRAHRRPDATGEIRRVRALLRMGWRRTDIAAIAGVAPAALSTAMDRGVCSLRMQLGIRRAYDQLNFTVGPHKGVASRAAAAGYAPPLAWDDDTIDDPNANPSVPDGNSVDEVAVRRAMQPFGDPTSLTSLEKHEYVRQMTARGTAVTTIATRLHWTNAAVRKVAA